MRYVHISGTTSSADETRYEYQDAHDGMKWKRCYGLEDWTFAEDGKMRKRQMSGNDIEISEAGKSPAPQQPGRSIPTWPSKTVHVLKHLQTDGSRTAWMSTKCKSAKRTGEVLLLFLSRWGIITLKCLVLELHARVVGGSMRAVCRV